MVTTAVAIVAVLVPSIASLPLLRTINEQEALASLARLADATAAAIEVRAPAGRAELPDRLAVVLHKQKVSAVYVPPGGPPPTGVSPADSGLLRAGRPVSGVRTTPAGEVLMEGRPLSFGGALVLTQPLPAALGGTTARGFIRVGLLLLAGVLVAVIAGLVLARRLARPLKNAATAAERMSRGDRDVVLIADGPAEVVEVSDALNQLNQALLTSEGRQRDFLLSISHELRTPLTAIRGYAEAIADGVVPPADLTRTGLTVQAEADRLDMLVSDLLDLARLDAVDFRIRPQSIDIAELGRGAAAVWQDRCQAAGVPFRAEIESGPIPAVTDPVRVRQILDNLAANALRVTPSGRPLVFSVRAHGDAFVVIEVRDGGPGLTADDCAVAFEPAELYSRYRGVRKVGTGVGLALVQRLAVRLGGGAEAGSAPEGGARFTVWIARQCPVPGPRV